MDLLKNIFIGGEATEASEGQFEEFLILGIVILLIAEKKMDKTLLVCLLFLLIDLE